MCEFVYECCPYLLCLEDKEGPETHCVESIAEGHTGPGS